MSIHEFLTYGIEFVLFLAVGVVVWCDGPG